MKLKLARTPRQKLHADWVGAWLQAWCYPIPITGRTRYHCDGGEGCDSDDLADTRGARRGHFHTHFHTNHNLLRDATMPVFTL